MQADFFTLADAFAITVYVLGSVFCVFAIRLIRRELGSPKPPVNAKPFRADD